MAYSQDIREEAFSVFCYATSYEDVVIIMRDRYPDECATLNRKTVLDWAKKYHWEQRKQEIFERVARQNDEKLVSDRQTMLGQLRSLREKLYTKIEKAELKSLEGGVNSYGNVLKWILELSGENERGKTLPVEDIIMIVFEVLAEHPKISKFMVDDEEMLLAAINQRIEAAE